MHTNSTPESAGPAARSDHSVPIMADDRRKKHSWKSKLYEATINCEFVEAGEQSHVIVDFHGDKALIMNGTPFYLGCARVPFSITDPDSPPICGSFVLSRDRNRGRLTLSGFLSDVPGGLQERFRMVHSLPGDVDDDDADWYKPLPGSVPTPVSNVSAPPACFVGKLEIVFQKDDGTTLKVLGTGTLIQADDVTKNGHYVLTCAHNLYDPAYGKAHSVKFLPGFNGQDSAHGHAGTAFFPDKYPRVAIGRLQDRSQIAPELLKVSTDLDYGLVKLGKPVNLKESNWPCMSPLPEGKLDGKTVLLTGLYGYNDEDDTMFQVVGGEIVGVLADELHYNASTDAGSSGTAVMLATASGKLEVVGVHVRAGGGKDNFNIARRLNASAINNIVDWQK